MYDKIVLKISQNSQENTCAGVNLNKVAGFLADLQQCFLVNFVKFLRKLFLKKTAGDCF